ncbi:MAG: alpha amylase C-terminal domain-containing protein [Nanobdellota archaeon]
MTKKTIPLRSIYYEWESRLFLNALSKQESFFSSFGTNVLSRDSQGRAKKIVFKAYNPDMNSKLYLVGDFNNWGEKNLETYQFKRTKDGFQTLTTTNISHKDEYLFMIEQQGKKRYLRDPATTYFSDNGNSIFWDYDDPTTYQKQHPSPNTIRRPTLLLQTDLPGLVSRWHAFDTASEPLGKTNKDLFTYIAECGVLDEITRQGYNTIQFLPISQSIDGDNWKYRYLSPFPFALQKNWGDPDSFSRLVDECHKRGIAVIADIILSHGPFKDFKIFNMAGEDVGIHTWTDDRNQDVFFDEQTSWGTKRFRFSNPHIRTYLVESALHFMTAYDLDGFRVDNVDGILRHGDNGQGADREGGREFLQTLCQQLYAHNPQLLIHFEAHYFYEDNARHLVAPLDSDEKALGATAYGSSRLTYFLHTEYMLKRADEISIQQIEDITLEKERTGSNSTIADFHNHDAAAGLMEQRAVGSYAYHAMTLGNKKLHKHAIGKIQTMEAIIALACEGRILDLAQTFLLQTGTFEHDSSIHWNLLSTSQSSKQVTGFKTAINTLLSNEPAFWPENTLFRTISHVDETNNVLVIRREDNTHENGKTIYAVINCSSSSFDSYAIGVKENAQYKKIFDSSRTQHYNPALSRTLRSKPSSKFKWFSQEIQFKLKPYHIICFSL